jgi:hypothetical protein
MADKCDPIRAEIKKLEAQLKKIKKFEKGPDGHPEITQEFADKQTEIKKARKQLEKCEGPVIPRKKDPPKPVPVTLTLTQFECRDQSDDIRVLGFNVEDDEPYAVVFAVDLKVTFGAPVGAINSKMTLIGPLADVDLETVAAPPNVIYGLSNASDFVTSADNLLVLVGMMENDSGSPNQVRTLLEKAGQVSLFTNLPAFASQEIPRQELVDRIINDMTGAMGGAKVGVPDPDDNIGSIQELRFFQPELDRIYSNFNLPTEKFLSFEGDDAKYTLKFVMFR